MERKSKKISTFLAVVSFSVVFLMSFNVLAKDAASLAKDSQNPVSTLISLPFEMNFNFNAGPENDTDYIMNIKPVIPMSFSENWNLINRAIIPVISQGDRGAAGSREFGLGDITYQAYLSPKKTGKFVWGVGPQLGMPTGMSRFSSDQWTLGPALVGLTMPGHWVIGALAANVWNIGSGYDDAPDVNVFSFQYFINYNMAGGWYVATNPTIIANWEANDSNTWTVPFGGSVGRVFKMGKQPVNMRAGAFYNVEKPDGASDWYIQLQFTLLFPKGK